MGMRVVDNRRARGWLRLTRAAPIARAVCGESAQSLARGADCPRHVWRVGAVLSLGIPTRQTPFDEEATRSGVNALPRSLLLSNRIILSNGHVPRLCKLISVKNVKM